MRLYDRFYSESQWLGLQILIGTVTTPAIVPSPLEKFIWGIWCTYIKDTYQISSKSKQNSSEIIFVLNTWAHF